MMASHHDDHFLFPFPSWNKGALFFEKGVYLGRTFSPCKKAEKNKSGQCIRIGIGATPNLASTELQEPLPFLATTTQTKPSLKEKSRDKKHPHNNNNRNIEPKESLKNKDPSKLFHFCEAK